MINEKRLTCVINVFSACSSLIGFNQCAEEVGMAAILVMQVRGRIAQFEFQPGLQLY
jgi:hypothetical protein